MGIFDQFTGGEGGGGVDLGGVGDGVTTTTTTGFGQNLANSIGAFFGGIAIFFLSFVVLYFNEGRPNLGNEAEKSAIIAPEKKDTATQDGKLVSLTGTLETKDKISDGFFMRDGNYLAVSRTTKIYAYKQNVKSKTKKNTGGSSTTTKTYTITKEWTTSPKDVSSFNQAAVNKYERNNGVRVKNVSIPSDIESTSVKAENATIGAWTVLPNESNIPSPGASTPLELSKETIRSSALKEVGGDISGSTIVIDKGREGDSIGDMRVTLSILPNKQTSTLFATLKDGSFIPFFVGGKEGALGENRLFEIRLGDRETAIKALKDQDKLVRWGLRVLGFLMMFGGLMAFFEPLLTVLQVLPFLRGIGEFVIKIAMFVLALVLSAITILVSIVIHNIVALIIVLVLAVGLIVFAITARGKKKGETKAAA